MAGKKIRPGRGRLSSIDTLPEDLRIQVNQDLRGRDKNQKQILEDINPVLEDRGRKPVSKSALNRYAMQIEEKGAMMREARAAADALVGGLGEHKGTDLGRAVTEMVKTLSFDMVVNRGDLDVNTLNKIALIAQRIERASKISLEREAQLKEQVRQQALEEAAQTVEQNAVQSGMTEAQAQLWREKILGIK